MAKLKLTVWNVEWMNELFTGNPPQFHDKNHKGYRTGHKVGKRIKDLAGVVNEIDSDVWLLVEGPNQKEELQLFFDHDEVNGNWQCEVQPSGAQSVGIAVRTDREFLAETPIVWYDVKVDAAADQLKKATNEFRMDTDDDEVQEVHKFERLPLYASIHFKDGKECRVLGLHLKSKGIFQALEWSKWWQKSDGNRKKIVAQCKQLRNQFLTPYMLASDTANIPLIVCGDINDGPGFDTSEMNIVASGVESLMGNIWHPKLALGNVMFDSLSNKDKEELDFRSLYTASFADPIFNRSYRRAWIDHILYTRRQRQWVSEGTIHHRLANGESIFSAFPKSSDHRPVSCIINSALF